MNIRWSDDLTANLLMVAVGVAWIIIYTLLRKISYKISPKLGYTLFDRKFTPLKNALNQDDDERAHEPFVVETLTDTELEWLEWLLKNNYSAISMGPFSAKIERKLAAKDGHRVAESMHYKTIFHVQIRQVHNYSFTINFPHRIRKDISRRDFQKRLVVLCNNDEFRRLLLSPEFIDALFKLNSLAPGSIQCVHDVFRVELNRTLKDETILDDFVESCRHAFQMCAQQWQLILPEWRGHDWWGEGGKWHKNADQAHAAPGDAIGDSLYGDIHRDLHGNIDHPVLEEARRQLPETSSF